MKITNSLKFRTTLFAITAMVIVIILTGLGCRIFNKRFYKRNAQQNISQLSEKIMLSFVSKVNKEIALSEKMVTSPVIREYMKDPSNPEWKDSGLHELKSYENSFRSKLSFWISDKDRHYFANCEYKYTLDVNSPSDAWYLPNLNAGGNYSFYVDYEKAFQSTYLWINGIVRDENGKPLGLAGTGIPLSDFIKEIYAELDPSYEMYMFNSGMEVSAARDNQKLIDDKTLIQKVLPLAQIPDKIPSKTIMVSAADGEYIISPISEIGWGLVIKCPLNLSAVYSDSINVLGYTVIFISALIILVFYLFISKITGEIKYVLGALSSSIEEIENGEADLTKRMLSSSQDELGEMIYEYNRFIEKLQQIVADIKLSEEGLNGAGSSLNRVISGTSETMEDILDGIVNSESKVTVQNRSVANTTLEIEKISSNIESLEQLIMQQSESVDNAFSSIRAMIENIDSVNRSVEDMAGSFGDLKEKTRSGSEKQTAVNERIKDVENQSRMLQDANQAISNIAEQTNLLAMNAAIEAAHAGEVGKGFSVVADEIRKLSETSGAQSKTIGEQLEKIRDSIQSVVQTSEESRKSFDLVHSEISRTDEIVQGIKISMNQQQDKSHQIGKILEDITSSTRKVLNASKEMSSESSVINEEIVHLKSATKDISESIQKMSGGAGKMKEDEDQLASISTKVNGVINQISGQVGKLKV